ncbi:hypothetical protein HDU79_001098, partial [Rhizoclosmatium sp. JEL0117]
MIAKIESATQEDTKSEEKKIEFRPRTLPRNIHTHMTEKDLKQYEEGIDGVLPKATDFDGLDLTPNELRLKKLEIEMNAHIDAKIMQNPDKMPTAVWFIIPNELGERFCYYGLTPILKNFLKYQLGYLAKVDANFMYHIFQGLCYYTPLLGSVLSDSYLD